MLTENVHVYSPSYHLCMIIAGVAITNLFCLFRAVTTAAVSSGSYQHKYTTTFSISGLPEHPNYIELFLHVQTNANPAKIKITCEHIEEPVIWTQRLPKDDSEIPKVQLVRISLNSVAASSLWKNDSSVTLTVASTNVIRIPSKNHYQNSVGLVLYMGGAPEEIQELLDTSIVSSDLTKHAYSIGAVAKRTAAKRSGSTPCQLQSGFTVKFQELTAGYKNIILPKMVDIKKCVGECPHYLHRFHNPSQHAAVRNLLAFRDGSASSDITKASCVPTSFKELTVMEYNETSKGFTNKVYKKMIASSCGCR